MNLRETLKERYGKPHLSYSSLKHALGDMRYWEAYMRGEIKYESPALTFGSLYDCLLLTPNKVPELYTVMPDEELKAGIKAANVKNTKEYKRRVAEFQSEAEKEGKTVVTEQEWDCAKDMISRMDDEGLLDRVLQGGSSQVEFNEDIDGVPLKGFLDYDHPDYVLDSKSTRSVDKFRYDVNSFCYDIQAYIYMKVTGRQEFYWLVQEKTAPYYPALVKCSDKTLFAGEMKFEQALSNIQDWLSTEESEQRGYGFFEV